MAKAPTKGPSSRMTGAERKQRIIEATEEVVAEYGVQGASTSRIAAAAGISEKTLYSHFESRKDMLSAAMDAVFEKARAKTFLSRQDPDVLEHLRKTQLSRRLSEGGFVFPLYEFFASPPDAGLRGELKTQHEVSIKMLMDMIEEGKAQGVIRADVDSEQAAWDVMFIYWADDVAYLLGFDVTDRTSVMAERLFREIAVDSSEVGRAAHAEGNTAADLPK
jgi:AcrR family transcriptional regulator